MGETLEFENEYYWHKYVSKQYPEDLLMVLNLQKNDPDPKRDEMANKYLTLVHHAGTDRCFYCNASIDFNVETLWVLRLYPDTIYCETCYQKKKDFTAFLHKFNLLKILHNTRFLTKEEVIKHNCINSLIGGDVDVIEW